MTTISAKEFFKGGTGKVTVLGSDQDHFQDTPHNPNYFERVWDSYKNSAKNIISSVNNSNQNPLSAGLQTAGEVAKSTFAPIAEIPGVKQATGAIVKGAIKTADVLSGRDTAQDIADVTAKYEDWKKQHPEAAGNLEASVNIAGLFAGNKGSAEAEQAAKQQAGKVVEKVGEKVATSGRVTKAAGKTLYDTAFTPNVKEAEQLLKYKAENPFLTRVSNAIKGTPVEKPITRSTTALEKGIMGTETRVGVQARRLEGPLWKEKIQPALKGSKEVITKDDLFQPIIDKIAKTTEPGKKLAYQDAFEAIQSEYKDVSKFTMEEGQSIKTQLDKFTPEKVFRGKPIANEYQELRADMAGAIRQKTYNSLKSENIKKAYLDYANLKELEKIGVKAISEAGTKGGFGKFWTTMWDSATTPVKTIGGQVLYRVGNKIEFRAAKGIKNFGQYLRKNGFKKP